MPSRRIPSYSYSDLESRDEVEVRTADEAEAMEQPVVTMERTFQVIAANASQLIEGSQCLLLEMDPVSGDLVVVASSEPDDADLFGVSLRVADPSVLLDRRVELDVKDLVWGPRVSTSLRKRLDMKSAVLLPLLVQHEVIGSLLLFTRRRRRYSFRDVSLAEGVAMQAAIAIHNARLYRDLAESQRQIQDLLSRIVRIRETERRNLASIVHDDVVQSIVGAVYELQALRPGVVPEATPRLEKTIAVLRTSIQEARRVISDLRPPALDKLGLSASLRALVDRANDGGPPRVELRVEDLGAIDSGTAAALYKVAREALANARRHARAEHVWIEVSRRERGRRHIRLVVRDDGIGIDGEPRSGDNHFGWTMMQEQAALVGGHVSAVRGEGGGTVVEAVIPG